AAALSLGGSPAPAAGLDVTLTATGPNASLLKFSTSATGAGSNPLTVHVLGGATTATYYLQVFGNSGSVTYTAQANNYQTGTGTAHITAVTPSGFSTPNGFTVVTATVTP